ncbi:MAG: phenylalanine--tRNA ligase subunit beta [Anaerovoracaceae bacterium]
MLVSLKWLKDYIDVDVDVETFADRMIMSGSNLETVEPIGEGIKNVVIGKIVEINKHPDADKLNVCMVDIGSEVLQIVCGAPNVAVGKLVIVALHGSTLPGGVKIKRGKLRGVESNGMLCSAGELGYGDSVSPYLHKDGIWLLPEDFELGSDFVKAMEIEDHVIDFEITPNRSDCLSMIGMARETAATFGKKLRKPAISLKEEVNQKTSDLVDITIENENACPRYVGRVVKDIVIKESPLWIQQRLMNAGMRPINNIVDITNFVMLEYGQPIHAFDLASLEGSKIIVSNAKEGEKFTTLDGKERELDPSMLMIRDGKKAVALAGVMGGLNSEIEMTTKNVMIEVANFEADGIRATSKAIGLRTEASARYEKGVDPNLCKEVADRVCHLIEETGSGKVCKDAIDVYPKEFKLPTVEVRIKRMNDMLGTSLTSSEMKELLERLEFVVVDKGDILVCTPPETRLDMLKEVDYTEEIARMFGYDNLPNTIPRGSNESSRGRNEDIRKIARDSLCAMGANEITTYSFVSPKSVDMIGITDDEAWEKSFVKIINPLGTENSVMRTLLTPGLLSVLATNYNRNIESVKAFELGSTFMGEIFDSEQLPTESNGLCIGGYGEGFDFFHLKGMIVELLKVLGIKDVTFVAESEYGVYHPGRCARIIVRPNDKQISEAEAVLADIKRRLDVDKEAFGEEELNMMRDIVANLNGSMGDVPIEIGIMGEIHPDVAENFGIGTRVCLCEMLFETVIEMASNEKGYSPLPKYPATSRDIALLVEEEVPVGHIKEVIEAEGTEILEEVKLFDIYRGKQVAEGKKSVAFSLRYRHKDKTLTEEDVAAVHGKVLEALNKEFGAVLREM